jgi:hypothetical protein
MIVLHRDGLRIEAAAIPELDGSCCVTAEVFDGSRMIRGYYRHVEATPARHAEAARAVAEELACMSSEAE